MTQKNNPKEKLYTCRVDTDLLEDFKTAAKANDRPASILVRDFMREYVKENQDKLSLDNE